MNITKSISFTASLEGRTILDETAEVQVPISVEDIANAIYLDSEILPRVAMTNLINRAAESMRALKAETIAELSAPARQVIHKFLIEQAARFEEGTR